MAITALFTIIFLMVGGYGYYIAMSEVVTAHGLNILFIFIAAFFSGYGWFMFASRIDDPDVLRFLAVISGSIVFACVAGPGLIIFFS